MQGSSRPSNLCPNGHTLPIGLIKVASKWTHPLLYHLVTTNNARSESFGSAKFGGSPKYRFGKITKTISRNIESNNFTPKTNELSQGKIPFRPSWTNQAQAQVGHVLFRYAHNALPTKIVDIKF